MTRTIRCVNWQRAVEVGKFAALVQAVAAQVTNEYAAAWPQAQGILLTPTTSANVGEEAIWCVSSVAGQPPFLGEHMVQSGVPVGLCLVKPSEGQPGGFLATLSHEVLEQIVDPFCNGGMFAAWGGRPAWLALETCDAVEEDVYGAGVSNFILPAWFVAGSKGPWDHLGRLKGPLTMTAGGYTSYFAGGSWQQSYGRTYAAQETWHPWDRARRRALQRERSSGWPAVEKAHLKAQPTCQVCGTKDSLQVHHIAPFHLRPDLELEPANLITLCEPHHLLFGHAMNWRHINPSVVADSATWQQKIKEAT